MGAFGLTSFKFGKPISANYHGFGVMSMNSIPLYTSLIQRNNGVDGTTEVVDTLNEAFVSRAAYTGNNCAVLDGASSIYGEITLLGNDNISIAGWVRLSSLPANGYLFRADGSAYILISSTGAINGSGVVGGTVATTPSGTIETGNIYFICVTLSSTGIANFYLNGVQVGSADQQSSPSLVSSSYALGAFNTSGLAGILSKLSDFKIYNQVLTNAEQLELYNGGILDCPYFGIPISEGAGVTAHNTSGNGFNSTLSSGVTWGTDDDIPPVNLDYGFSLYEHATLDPLRIPFLCSGIPNNYQVIPTGYTFTKNVEGCLTSGAVLNAEVETKILGTDADMLACSLYSPDGLTLTAFSFAEAQAFVSGTDNHWLRWGLDKYGSCALFEDNQYDFSADLQETVAMYNRFAAFYKQCDESGGIIPYV